MKWIANLLSQCVQRVKLNGTIADWRTLTSGVPQGSILGHTLFAMVVDTLVRCAQISPS